MNNNGKYIIGIDGGGTKTTGVLADEQGNSLARLNGNPANFLIIGIDKAAKNLSNLILDLCNEAEINWQNIEVVSIGLTGAGRQKDAERIKKGLSEYWDSIYSSSFKNILLNSDARIALEGAFSGKPGIILICGTGSIMFGKDSDGNIYRVGGFGRYIGDEGSGYSIGRKGLGVAGKYFDGRGENTLLIKKLSEKFSIFTAEDLINKVYKENFDIASIAPLVISCADEGDDVCCEILDEEVDEILLHIQAMKSKVKVKDIPLAFIGGLLANENYYSKKLKKSISKKIKNVTVIEPENTPEYGAVLLGMDLIKLQNKAS